MNNSSPVWLVSFSEFKRFTLTEITALLSVHVTK